MKQALQLLTLTVIIASASLAAHATENQTITDAIKNGKVSLSLRLRYEDVDVDNATNDDADALTLKTRLNYATGSYQGFKCILLKWTMSPNSVTTITHQCST